MNGMAEPALSLKGVSKAFGRLTVVDDVSLDVAHGEIVSLVGASGCGKSTLLRLVAGLEEPSAGAIEIGGREVAGTRGFVEPERRGVGFIFQDYALFPHLSVVENVRYGLRGAPRAQAEATAREMLDKVGLAAFGDRHPHMLSGGEQQRVALARAIAPKPAVLLLDEPFSNLDRRLGERVRSHTLSVLRALGAAAILVTHDPDEAMASGDRVALMRKGRIVQVGSAEDLYDRPATSEAAGFFAAAARVAGRRVNGAVETPLGRFPAPLSVREGAIALVYVRARCVRLVEAGAGVPARLAARSFLGHGYELLLSVDGLDEPVRAHVGVRNATLPGDVVHICVNPTDGLVFPDDAASEG